MADPNLDIGLDYTGGITKPTLADVGRYARVALDGTGDPNLEYVVGVERRLFLGSPSAFTGSTGKTSIQATFKIPAGTFILGTERRIRIAICGEFPARAGTKVGVDVYGVGTEMDLLAAVSAPVANAAFFYECVIYPGGADLQRVFSELRISGLAPVGATAAKAADTEVDQEIRVTTQLANAADTIAFRRVEVFGIGF